MTGQAHQRGGAPVGYLDELPDVEAQAVRFLRLWCDGPETQAQIWNDFAVAFGQAQGRLALRDFERLCTLAIQHGRRRLMRHDVSCRCLGGDEAVFATFVSAAAEGDREDAMLFASLLVRSDMAPAVTDLAEKFGLALRRMAMRGRCPSSTIQMPSQRLH